jgi:hypothetical protein
MLENVTRLWLIVRLVMTRGHWSADWAATLTYRTLRVVMLIYFWLWHRFDHSVLIVIPLKLGAQSAKVHWKRPAGRGGRPEIWCSKCLQVLALFRAAPQNIPSSVPVSSNAHYPEGPSSSALLKKLHVSAQTITRSRKAHERAWRRGRDSNPFDITELFQPCLNLPMGLPIPSVSRCVPRFHHAFRFLRLALFNVRQLGE